MIMMSTFKSGLCVLLRFLARLLFRIEVRGGGEDYRVQPLLVIANHESFLDGLLLGLFLPIPRPVFVVHTEAVKNPVFRLFLRLADYLTVDPSNPMAMKTVIRLLKSGRPVVIFPEGRITRTGSLMKVYEGPAFVAARTGATLLPVRLDGPSRSYFSRLSPARQPRRLFPRITLTLLPLTRLAPAAAPTARARRRKAGEALRRLMQEMLFSALPEKTIYSHFCDAIARFGRGRHVLEDMKQVELRYQDILKMALALGRLVSKKTRPDERVGILLPNIAPTVGLFLGLTALRRVPAMLNYTAGTEGMQVACTAAQIRTLVTSRAFLEQARLTEKVAALEGIEQVIYLETLRDEMRFLDRLWILAALCFPRHAEIAAAPEDDAVVLFTSGSEGKPKGVVLSHRAILANIAQIRAVIDFNPEDRVLNVLPIFHSFGLTAGTFLPLLTGAGLFLYPSPLHYRVIPELAYERGCTVLFGTSTFLGNYARFAHPYDFYRLRYVVAGAEKLADTVREQWFEKFGLRILEGYGATETAPVIAVNTPMAFRSGTVGQPLPGIEWRLQAVPGIERGGELHVRGPNLMNGYLRYERPGVLETPKTENGPGWYATGDIADIDDDGFLRLVGRVRRFAKIAGEMVSLESVEALARAAVPEGGHAVVSQADSRRGEALVLFTTNAALKREHLQTEARRAGLPELMVPRKIVHLAALPLLGTGKTDYVALKRSLEIAP
ncbi:MAG: bifunctional acyl-ACP--phospholipid O-acyltransferase/long-chain-fatty-acid--ACP ligase [Zoogloeaceae bacterium]|nr:bifunctional acyl-ACP--phospholipid O-acyltransferase/long-chain-fatty-acid--ACP ligase [Zoogloeaceae bacterium]